MLFFDPVHFAAVSRIVWQRGGYDTLVKVLPFLAQPDGARPVGRCTTYKHLAGCTGPAIARMFDLPERVFAAGIEAFAVAPLPAAGEFDFLGYVPVPGGVAPDPPGYVGHPLYRPALGMPVWDLVHVPQSRLVPIARVPRGQALNRLAWTMPPSPE